MRIITARPAIVASVAGSNTATPWRVATFEFGTNGGTPVSTTDGVNTTNGDDTTVDTTRAYAGTKSMKCTVAIATNNMGGVIQMPSVNNGGSIANGDELWCRYRVYIPDPGWSMTTGDGGMKFFRWRTYITGGVPAGSNTIQLWGAGPTPSGLRTEQEGATPDTQLFVPSPSWNNRWVTIEEYIKIGTGTSGKLRSWVDGTLRGEVLNCDTLGSTAFLSIDANFLDYFNNGAPQSQSMWIDDIQIYWSGLQAPNAHDSAGNAYVGM